MIELIEKSLLTALGAMTLSQKKAEELSKEFRDKLNLSEEEGKAFLKKIQDAALEQQAKLESAAQEEVKKACDRMGLVSQEEFNKLKRKISHLEKQIKDLSA
ncbi:MAG: phasin family protein [Deltaproteobacteria bacterium]|jgi:polyhydroxyalkanoate synthesis regulator phasin|nr:phasin family protein [Deltaproteobacteria bacterium]